MSNTTLRSLVLPLLAVALCAAAPRSGAADFYLYAGAVDVTMPDATVVPMWGYALEPDNDFTTLEGTVQVPGPQLSVPVGDSAVNIYLYNDLTVPVSITITGQIPAFDPGVVRIPESDPDYPAPAGTGGRIRSFVHETAPGAIELYSWADFKPGTFLYKSGTHQQVQVPMGLYGAITQDYAPGQAYEGAAYDNEVVLLYSAVQPALAAAVTTPGGYGASGTMMTSTLKSLPRYFLINGQPWSDGAPIVYGGLAVGQTTLLRFLNATSETVIPTLYGGYLDIVAEDGNPRRVTPLAGPSFLAPLTQYTVTLTAGKTHDALFAPTRGGAYPIIDRYLNLTNGAAPDGGFQLVLDVAADPNLPAAVADSYSVAEDGGPLTVPADGVLANDSVGGGSGPLVASLVQDANHGTLSFGPDGSFSYSPDPDYFGADFFLYQASDGSYTSDPVSATLVVTPVNDPPVGVADSLTTAEDLPLSVPAPGILGNDIDVDHDVLSALLVSTPGHGSVSLLGNGSLTYTPDLNYFGGDSFQYEVRDAVSSGGTVTVTIDVTPVNDTPVGAGEAYPLFSSPLEVAAPGVLGNDTDVEGSPLSAILVTSPFHGAVALAADGSFSYTPDPGYVGTDYFRYKPSDGSLSGPAVRVDLYVFPVFYNGFELGGLGGWSAVTP